MSKPMPSEAAIDAAVSRLNAAQSAHAECLKYNHAKGGFDVLVTDEELSAKYVASLEAERDYCALFGDAEGAEQIGYQIEIEVERIRRITKGA